MQMTQHTHMQSDHTDLDATAACCQHNWEVPHPSRLPCQLRAAAPDTTVKAPQTGVCRHLRALQPQPSLPGWPAEAWTGLHRGASECHEGPVAQTTETESCRVLALRVVAVVLGLLAETKTGLVLEGLRPARRVMP